MVVAAVAVAIVLIVASVVAVVSRSMHCHAVAAAVPVRHALVSCLLLRARVWRVADNAQRRLLLCCMCSYYIMLAPKPVHLTFVAVLTCEANDVLVSILSLIFFVYFVLVRRLWRLGTSGPLTRRLCRRILAGVLLLVCCFLAVRFLLYCCASVLYCTVLLYCFADVLLC